MSQSVTIPSVLSFKRSEIKEFKMFAGSNKGAVELDTSGYDPKKIWRNHISPKESFCKEMMLGFINNNTLCFFPDKYIYQYKLENRVLQIFDTMQNKWLVFAYGDKDKLVIKQGLTGIGKGQCFNQYRVKNNDETCFGVFNYAGIYSLSFLKDKQAMIAWCNVHYTFQ